jgi:predicted RNase H-like HicB family nuclease
VAILSSLFVYRQIGEAPAMTPKYHINLFWSEADAAWIADVPDLQSCSAFGDTSGEALAEVEKAMQAWLAVAREDGPPTPKPRYGHEKRTAG